MDLERIGDILRLRRIQLHYTKSRLARETGLSRNQIYNIEKGIKSPTVDTLCKICNKLRLDIKIQEV